MEWGTEGAGRDGGPECRISGRWWERWVGYLIWDFGDRVGGSGRVFKFGVGEPGGRDWWGIEF